MMIDKNCNVRARAVEVLLAESAQKKTPGIQINFTVTEGEFQGQSVRYDGWFSEKTAERVIESLQYCGWEGDDVGEFADRGLHGLDTNEVELVIELEDYQGNDPKYEGRSFPRVAWVNKLGGRGLNVDNAMTPDVASAFGAKMKGLVLKSRQKTRPADDVGDTSFNHGANAPLPRQAAGGKRF
jgi:hypothetical protein